MIPSRPELSVGIFALGVITILSMMTFRVGEFSIGKKAGYVVIARFHNTAGLSAKTKIKIAGVNAGVVEGISLVEGAAFVKIRLKENVRIYSDAVAVIRSTGLLGDKYIEISIGMEEPFLEDGSEIVNVVEVAEVDDLIKNLTDISFTLSKMMITLEKRGADDNLSNILSNVEDITKEMRIAIAGDKKNLRNILTRIESIMANIDRTVQASSGPLTNTIKNAEAASEKAPELMDELYLAVTRLNDLLEQTSPSIVSIANNTDLTMSEFQQIARKVNEGEGTIGKLINDEELYEKISNAAGGLSNTLGRADKFRTYVNFRGDYLSSVKDGKGQFTLELAPRDDKYYILGIVTDPIGTVSTTETTENGITTTTEEVDYDFEFILQFARRYKDTTLRIGFIESTFGVGADQYLLNDRVRFSADAWDFGEDEYLSVNPHVRLALDLFVTRNIFLSGGYDNVFNSGYNGYFVGAGMRFEDEDLKYLLGSMPSLPGN